jgi:hypothetical protein
MGTGHETPGQGCDGLGQTAQVSPVEESRVMERHRCTKCRNPIRNVAVARPGASDDEWYHPDCWQEVCSFEQTRYERQVQSTGLSALLAPYAPSSPVGAVEQPLLPDGGRPHA